MNEPIGMSGFASKESRHKLADRKDDFYASPLEAVDSFIAIEEPYLPRHLWEPACGDGAMVMPLRQKGYSVLASDLVARGCPDSSAGQDFLMPFPVPGNFGGIVTNPPFKLASEFVIKSLSLAPYVAILARIAFLEGIQRRPMFKSTSLARVHVSSRRLPMMHRDGWDGPISTSATCFAWFVWDARHAGEPVIRWFDWKDHAR
tara:strand:- start:331 stop:939 length:609 start_codon:yes stop_codon:yes gene_type:complete